MPPPVHEAYSTPRPGPDGSPPVAVRHVDPSYYGVDPAKVVHRDVPGWTRDENALYRGDTRSPEEIKAAGGFDVKEPAKQPDLLQHVHGDTNGFVSTTSDQRTAIERAGTGEGKVYVVKAPGGIMTDATLDSVGDHRRRYSESETLFPGGIDWRYVEGWHQVRHETGQGLVLGPFVPNPDFVGHNGKGSDGTTAQSDGVPDTTRPRAEEQAPPRREPGAPQHNETPAKADVPERQAGPTQALPRPADVPRPSIAERLNTAPPTHQPSQAVAPTRAEPSPVHDRLNTQESGQPQHETERRTPEQDRSERESDRPGQEQERPQREPERPDQEPDRPDQESQRDDTPSEQDRNSRDEEPPERPRKPLSDRLDPLGGELDANVRDHVHTTPAGMSIFDRSQDRNEFYTARELPRIPGQFVVDLHGSAHSARVGNYPLTPRDVADIIRANPDYRGEPVTLVGCDTGRRDDGFAARLAQELGAPVTAPNTDAWVDYNGNLFATRTQDNERPGWPPDGEWRTFGPDGSQQIHESPHPPGHTPEWGDDTPEFAPETAERRGEREDDFRDMRDDNREKREEGLDSVRELTGRNPSTDAERRPHERTLSTARYRSDRDGESADFYNFSGKQHDWSPAAEAPQQPPKNERLFETSNATSYDPESGSWRDGSGTPRVNDSEPKMFEDLARHQLAEYSGLSRNEVDTALRDANKTVDTLNKEDPDYYKNGFKGEVQRTQDRMSLAIDELNRRGAARAEANGTTYTPFSAADISGDLRMVVDLPSAKRDGTPAEFQICMSCQKIMLAYERVFPNMRLEVVNRAGERLYPL
ncbi:enterotoxin A family protein [Lentzea sp. NPDC003310]|uniref:scabin-related ADP-ribosyltransferase n=1 Tax=Lentzea sp. NPDC003310 TaxID=3154447 RepID=UPI0033B55398